MDTLRPPPAARTQSANIVYPVGDGEMLVPGVSERLQVMDWKGRTLHAVDRSYTLEVAVDGQADTIVQVAARPVLKTPAEKRGLEARISADPRFGGALA